MNFESNRKFKIHMNSKLHAQKLELARAKAASSNAETAQAMQKDNAALKSQFAKLEAELQARVDRAEKAVAIATRQLKAKNFALVNEKRRAETAVRKLEKAYAAKPSEIKPKRSHPSSPVGPRQWRQRR